MKNFFPDKFVFQESELFPWRTAIENVMLGFYNEEISKKEKEKKALDLLGQMGLKDHYYKYPKSLSGGMKKRVALARALATNSDIILMDEPFSSLDELIRERQQMLILNTWKKFSKTIIFVTHDIREAALLGNKILVFSKEGKIKAEKENQLPGYQQKDNKKIENELRELLINDTDSV